MASSATPDSFCYTHKKAQVSSSSLSTETSIEVRPESAMSDSDLSSLVKNKAEKLFELVTAKAQEVNTMWAGAVEENTRNFKSLEQKHKLRVHTRLLSKIKHEKETTLQRFLQLQREKVTLARLKEQVFESRNLVNNSKDSISICQTLIQDRENMLSKDRKILELLKRKINLIRTKGEVFKLNRSSTLENTFLDSEIHKSNLRMGALQETIELLSYIYNASS